SRRAATETASWRVWALVASLGSLGAPKRRQRLPQCFPGRSPGKQWRRKCPSDAAIMNEPRAPYAARVAAAEALLDRGWGKPRQSHEAEITRRYVIEIPALMDNAEWEAEAIEHEPDKLQ